MKAPNILHASLPPAVDTAVSVLVHWRCFGADEFTAARRARVEAFVAKAAVADVRWRLAAAGDAAAAIGLALSRHSARFPDLQFDVAMTAVLYCGLRGDPAARVVLAAMIRNSGDSCASERIAASWNATPAGNGPAGRPER